jgi:hypothetical protein
MTFKNKNLFNIKNNSRRREKVQIALLASSEHDLEIIVENIVDNGLVS